MRSVPVRYRLECSIGVIVLGCLLLGVGCSSDSEDPKDGVALPGVPSGYSIAAEVDPHVVALAEQLMAAGGLEEVVGWAGGTLAPEDYKGAMRSAGGVISGYMGNDVDRCRLVRELLSTAGIANRFAMDGDSFKIEAWIDDQATHVPTSTFDEGPIPEDWARGTSIPPESFHTIELVERLRSTTSFSTTPVESENSLGNWTLATVASVPVLLDYVQDSEGLRLRVRTGRRNNRQESFGVDVGDIEKHELILRYTQPGQEPVDHHRIMFDRTARIMNQSPDVGSDVYAIWFGANVVGESYFDVENALADFDGDDAETSDVLYLRAIELAMETDNAAWQLLENAELGGGAFFDSARIVIAAQERRFDGHDGVTPSFDLLRNTRRILASSDPVAARFALGYSDAMVEGALLERTTGSSGVTVPNIFAGMFRDEPDDVLSRADLFEDALRRLEEEGVTQEGLVFSDEVSGAQVEIALVGADLLLVNVAGNVDRLLALGGELSDELTRTIDGVVLGDGSDRSWPIDLLLLDGGAALNYTPRIEHLESPQLGLATPSGTYVLGSGSYLGQSLQFHGIARVFEEAGNASDPDSKRDVSDWHFFDEAGVLVGSGSKAEDTAALDEKSPRILQWGESTSTVSFYESPLWIAPEVAAGIRAGLPTDCRITSDTGGAADWVGVTFAQFTDSRMTITIDSQPVGISTIVATDEAQEYEITIAKIGLTRLILGLRTPNGESRIDSIVTPRELRLRGRVMSYRSPLGFSGTATHAVGVPNARVSSSGLIGTSWPDGSVDLRVSETAQPTLIGSIGILVDTSNSMNQSANQDCVAGCTTKIDVVSLALADIVQQADEGIELAVWGFPSTFDGSCDAAVSELAGWSLSRMSTDAARNSLTIAHLTGGTPLTGAVRGALDEMDSGALGVSRRLIVLADGDNDCDSGLDSVSVPMDVEIHTVGIGLTAGGDAELQLMDLAERGRGTYTRTVDGDDLTAALTGIAALPFATPVVDVVSTQIEADEYVSTSVEFPVDQDGVVVYLNEAPDRDVPGFVVVQPGEAFPTELVAIDAATLSLIEGNRARRPEVTLVMPDRLISIGGWTDAFGWLEIDAETGETTAVTSDGLHGAGGVIYFGATVLGLWAGADAVISNFSGCVLAPGGCGSDLAEIRQTICATTGYGPAIGAIAISWIGTVFTSANGFALDQSYATGLSVVNKLCSTEFDLTGFVASTRDNAISDGLSEVPGGWVGFGYSLMVTIWNNSGGSD